MEDGGWRLYNTSIDIQMLVLFDRKLRPTRLQIEVTVTIWVLTAVRNSLYSCVLQYTVCTSVRPSFHLCSSVRLDRSLRLIKKQEECTSFEDPSFKCRREELETPRMQESILSYVGG